MRKMIFILTFLIQTASAYTFNEELVSSFLDKSVSKSALYKTIEFYEDNQNVIKNKRYISIIDYSLSAQVKRFFILDLKTGSVQREYVSHAKKSDKNLDQSLDTCQKDVSNKRNMTRPGFMLVSNPYVSYNWGYGKLKNKMNALKLDGLETRNKDVRKSYVVRHEAFYMENYLEGQEWLQGWSRGCPSVAPGRMPSIMSKIKGGSLLYAFIPICQ